MLEVMRGRDCIVLFKGDAQPVTVSDELLSTGWPGGQGVQWTDGTNDERTVCASKGLYGGILIWGSDEEGDGWTAITDSQVVYRTATMLSGGNLIMTRTFERHTWASRQAFEQGLGPLVPITYRINQPLFFSMRGWFTNEDEATLSGAAWAPAFFVGFVAQLPKEATTFFMGVQTSM